MSRPPRFARQQARDQQADQGYRRCENFQAMMRHGALHKTEHGCPAYLRNVSRFLNSTMMNSAAAAPMFSGRCTFPSLHPSAPPGTEAGALVPSGSVKLKV